MSALSPIVRQAVANASRVAVVDDQRSYTYGQLLGAAAFVAEKIDAKTGKPQVGILLPTSGAFPIALVAAWLSGRVAVPMNYLLATAELRYVIEDSGVDLILASKALWEHLTKTHNGAGFLPEGVQVVMLDDIEFEGVPPFRWPPVKDGGETAVVLYTSGTSGRPKGVMLSHGNLRYDVEAAIVHAELRDISVFAGVLPQFHSFGLSALTLLPLYIGAKVVYTARFVPRRVIQLVAEHKAEVIIAVPSMYAAMLHVKSASAEDMKTIKVAVSGGEPLPRSVADAFMERYQVRLLEGYGLTETSPISHWLTHADFTPGSVGRPLPGVHTLIAGDKDRPLPPGQDGEILLSGPHIMQGYYKLPQQTAETFVELPIEGGGKRRYFRTGDIGREDERGRLYITGRKKEMLIVAGENVFPREIEEVLEKHPMVKAAAVIGRKDDLRGEQPVGFVEINEGQAYDEHALREWCSKHLAGYKAPREIRQIDALPRNATGKVMRRQLKL